MKVLFVCLFIAVVVAPTTYAHICMFSPHQRGDLNVSIPGDPTCFQRFGQCGSAAIGEPTGTYNEGDTITVHYQQNLNHWYPPKPGHFDVSVSTVVVNPQDSDFTVLAQLSDWPAHDMVTQTNMTISAQLPSGLTCDKCVLRLRYVSNNVMEIYPKNNTHAIFYQCADIKVVAASKTTSDNKVTKVRGDRVKQETDMNCVTPPAWTIDGMGVNDDDNGVFHRIWYSKAQNMVRWDRQGSNKAVSLYTNYTSEREYIYSLLTDECVVYGPDAWYDWAYGSTTGMSFVKQVHLPNNVTQNVYVLKGMDISTSPMTWWANVGDEPTTCMPDKRDIFGQTIQYMRPKVGPVNPVIFELPHACSKSRVRVADACRKIVL